MNTDLDGMPPVNGAHRDNGMFIMQAPSLRRGLELQGAEIIDLAPTILYLFGEPIHSNMDGHVLIDGFDDSYRMRFPVRFIDDEATIRLSGRDYNSEEAEVIEKRLRDLGYID